jgi:ubiquinone/menaquinone biosynthesis C-methylase UbiE
VPPAGRWHDPLAMNALFAMAVLLALLVWTGLFFFVVTRGALLVRALSPRERGAASHVYPIYSNMRLIRLVDFQPVISAILLFQYKHLVTCIVEGLKATDLKDKKVLITSCAFGNVIPRVVEASVEAGAQQVRIVDIIDNELTHAKSKLGAWHGRVDYVKDDATAMTQPEGFADANVMFFLLHELPHELKIRALSEAGRMLAPGGKLYLAEFGRPRAWILRLLSWTYFKVFEPLGLALWQSHDPVACLEDMGGWAITRKPYLLGNFQVITATKL